MSVSRRRFLKSSALVSAAFVLKPDTHALGRNSLWSNNPFNSAPAHSYRREMFAPYVGDLFRVRLGEQTVDLKLVAIENVPQAASGVTTGKIARTDCFSMRFHAATPLPTAAGLHSLNHRKLGSFDLFVSQSKAGSKFVQTAIVNHLA
jgi:Domain of unknown function (DUF6916)